MKIKYKIGFLVAGTLLSFVGLNLIIDSEATRSIGAIVASTGILTDIVMLLLIMQQGNDFMNAPTPHQPEKAYTKKEEPTF
jgi:hypothetical protein